MTAIPGRVALHKQQECIAHILYLKGPIQATYAGQAADRVADMLNTNLPRSRPFTRSDANHVIATLEQAGWLRKKGTTLISELRWIGPDPERLEWKAPARDKPSGPSLTSRIEVLERQMREIRADLGMAVEE